MSLETHVILSIIIPVYNADAFIEKCIHSVLRVIPLDGTVQIVVVNDGSKDNSAQIIDAYQHYPFVTIRHTANQGVAATRNLGVSLAQGKFIGFLDGDDYWSESVEWSSLASAFASEIDIIETAYLVVSEDESVVSTYCHPRSSFPNYEHINNQLLSSIAHDGIWYLWSRFYKRILWEDLSFVEGRIYEDIFLVPQVLVRAKTMTSLQLPLVCYRLSPESITRSPKMNNVFDLLYIAKEFSRLASNRQDIFAMTARSCYAQALRVYAKFPELSFPQTLIDEINLTRFSLRNFWISFDFRFMRYYLFPYLCIQNMHRVTKRKLEGRGRRSKQATDVQKKN